MDDDQKLPQPIKTPEEEEIGGNLPQQPPVKP
jgi:hypothetical protein